MSRLAVLAGQPVIQTVHRQDIYATLSRTMVQERSQTPGATMHKVKCMDTMSQLKIALMCWETSKGGNSPISYG